MSILQDTLKKEIKTIYKLINHMCVMTEEEFEYVALPNLHMKVFELIEEAGKATRKAVFTYILDSSSETIEEIVKYGQDIIDKRKTELLK